ncbi:hypothetical protein P691DRAFT_786987, partial [Macrolepiota fuliginosa MF-IS2]
ELLEKYSNAYQLSWVVDGFHKEENAGPGVRSSATEDQEAKESDGDAVGLGGDDHTSTGADELSDSSSLCEPGPGQSEYSDFGGSISGGESEDGTSSRDKDGSGSGDDEGAESGTGAPSIPVQQYVTIRALNLKDTNRLWGRGTTVFEVITLEDFKAKNVERLPEFDSENEVSLSNSSTAVQESASSTAVHRSTSSSSTLRIVLEEVPFEAHILQKSGLATSRLHDCGYVKSGGKNVETLEFIRHGLSPGAAQSSSASIDSRAPEQLTSGHDAATKRTQ